MEEELAKDISLRDLLKAYEILKDDVNIMVRKAYAGDSKNKEDFVYYEGKIKNCPKIITKGNAKIWDVFLMKEGHTISKNKWKEADTIDIAIW